MDNQPVGGSTLSEAEISSYIRGYHAYKDIWTPAIGDIVLLNGRKITSMIAMQLPLFLGMEQ